MQILSPHPRPAESGTLGAGPLTVCISKLSGESWHLITLENNSIMVSSPGWGSWSVLPSVHSQLRPPVLHCWSMQARQGPSLQAVSSQSLSLTLSWFLCHSWVHCVSDDSTAPMSHRATGNFVAALFKLRLLWGLSQPYKIVQPLLCYF